MCERPVQPNERGHRRFPGLAGTQQEDATGIGAEESLLPAVGVHTEKAGERHTVGRHGRLAPRPPLPEAEDLTLKLRRAHALAPLSQLRAHRSLGWPSLPLAP